MNNRHTNANANTTRTFGWTSALCTAALASLFVIWPAHAHAEELGAKGNIVFNVERLFGFYVDKQSVDVGPVTTDISTTDLSLGWNAAPTGLTLPRLGLDYFIDDHFTIGGNFGVFTLSRDNGGASTSNTGVLFGVRGGYALRLGHVVSFWPRVGFTYTKLSGRAGVGPAGLNSDSHLLSLGLEGMFSFAPSENWSFLVGPTIDLGLDGATAGNNSTENCFGIMAGFLVWLGT